MRTGVALASAKINHPAQSHCAYRENGKNSRATSYEWPLDARRCEMANCPSAVLPSPMKFLSIRPAPWRNGIPGSWPARQLFSAPWRTRQRSAIPSRSKVVPEYRWHRGTLFSGKPSGVFYDVGANVGLTSFPIARNRAVRCVGFEPDPENFCLLSGNIAANRLAGIELHNVAVADKRAKMGFTRSTYSSGDHRLSAGGEILVDCLTLDELPVPAEPFAIKIDTQGAEPLIFAGGEKHLAAAGLIVCEYWPWGMARMGTRPDIVIDFVKSFPGKGMLARHDQPFDNLIPAVQLVKQMEKLAASAGEFDDADLVLVRT